MNGKRIDVVGLGASTIDLITLVENFPERREVQQALGMAIRGGGPVATALVAVARLGGSAAMIDGIGEDWAGERVLHEFQAEGVDTSTVEIHRGCSTSVSSILVSSADGARAIIFHPGSAPAPSLNAAQRDAIRSAKILHITGRHWEACMKAIDLARDGRTRVSLDGGADRFRPEMKSLVPLTDICIVARDYAEKYTGEAEPSRSAPALLEEGPQIAAVTDGIHGSWVCTREGVSFHQPAFLFPDAIDTTGCGDGYHGAFLAALLKGHPAPQAAAIASAAAGMNARHLGGRAGLPTYEQVVKFLSSRGISLN